VVLQLGGLGEVVTNPPGKTTLLRNTHMRMRWAGPVTRMGEERGVYRILLGKPEGRNHRGDLGVDGWIILGRISRRWDVGIWTGLGWPRIETGGGCL